MQAYRFTTFGSLDALTLCEEPDAGPPQRGELLLRVRAVSLNYRDIAMVLGSYPAPATPGHVPTSDAVAEVVAVGQGVTDFQPGDRVLGLFHPRWFGGERPASIDADSYGSARDGWLLEYKIVPQEAVVRLPAALSDEEGATLPCAAVTAWSALAGDRAIRAGDTVLTQGTGGVSIFAVQVAKALGARVIATTSSAAKADRLRELGADAVIDYRETEDWGVRAKAWTGGRGVHRVVEVGGPATIKQSLEAVAQDCEVALVGFVGRDNPGLDLLDVFRSRARIRTISVGDRTDALALVRAVEVGGIKPVIDRIFPFREARAAFAHLAAAKHVGKIVVRVGD